MNTETLMLLVETARLGSFAAVARKLDMDPSSVSRAVAGAEEQLGFRLFQRSTRKLALTEAGELYLQRITPLLDEMEGALEEALQINQGPKGILKMTASVSFGQTCILPYIPEFKARYPDVGLELRFTDAVLDLVENGIDLACRLVPKFDSSMVGTKLFDTHYRVCVSPNYQTISEIQHPKDLEKHPCLTFTLPDYRSRWIFKNNQNELNKVNIQSDISISNALALKELAIVGMGPVLLADWLVDSEIEQKRLVHILREHQVTASDFDTAAWLLYPTRSYLPTKTRVMIDFLKEKLSPIS